MHVEGTPSLTSLQARAVWYSIVWFLIVMKLHQNNTLKYPVDGISERVYRCLCSLDLEAYIILRLLERFLYGLDATNKRDTGIPSKNVVASVLRHVLSQERVLWNNAKELDVKCPLRVVGDVVTVPEKDDITLALVSHMQRQVSNYCVL